MGKLLTNGAFTQKKKINVEKVICCISLAFWTSLLLRILLFIMEILFKS